MPDKQVKIFSTPTCPWCKRTKQFLDANGIKYQDVNVAEDKVARDEMVNKTHQLGVPTIMIDAEFVIGYNEKALREKLGLK
jgi:glutaredoxin 3